MTHLEISLLGPFHVTLDGKPITDFATDKARALLAYLAVESRHPRRREFLSGLLWPDQPEARARQNLRQALTHLRQSLGECQDASFLDVSRESVQFTPQCDYALDVAEFVRLANACQAHRHMRPETCRPCLRRMERMATLYRGNFLEQFYLRDSAAFEEWSLLKREWLARQAIEVFARLADFHERRGEYERARHYARRQIELEPWREEAHRHLMRLLMAGDQRSAALEQYQVCRRALRDELGVEPAAETTQLYEQIRDRTRGPGDKATQPPEARLPAAPTSFVGRETELAELAELVANPDCRLLTLVGPGGIGKTRLALRAAQDHVGAFTHGVHFVPLASISLAGLVAPAIADALGLPLEETEPPQHQLLRYLSDKEMLLVLDSLEHIIQAGDLLSDLLKRAPRVIVLATSRERLNLQEEWAYEVEGLDEANAVTLFDQRAHQAQRRFALSPAEAPHAARICRLVEGMPLGIELAAAWVAVRSCADMAGELEHNLDSLTTTWRNVPERHRSLRATLDYSWNLLTAHERAALARLSVFRGGFSAEAAGRVAGAATKLLVSLFNKSLIYRTAPERYELHQMVSQYAQEKLDSDPPTRLEACALHATYFAERVRQLAPRLVSSDQKCALDELALDIDNARRAWLWAVENKCWREVGLSVEGLYDWFDIRSRFHEGIALFQQALAGGQLPPDLTIQIMARQGMLHHRVGHSEPARQVLEQCLARMDASAPAAERIVCLVTLANVARRQGQTREAMQLAQAGLALAREAGDAWGLSSSLAVLGLMHYRAGEIEPAHTCLAESLSAARQSGNVRLLSMPINLLGDMACHTGDFDRAQRLFEEHLALSRKLDDQFNIALHLNNIGTILHVQNKYAEAGLMYQASLEFCRKIGDQRQAAVALNNLGEIALALGQVDPARQHYLEGLSIGKKTQNSFTIMAALNNLGELECAQGNDQQALAYLAETVQLATETRTLTMLMKALANLAVLLVHQGQTQLAAELLALVRDHPASERDLQNKAVRLLNEHGLTAPAHVRPLSVVMDQALAKVASLLA
jgi:predicted ATPase/DNA-binding SARP family transcriptional activator/tetratricopeptide (TPR) repeat protein